MRHDDQTGFEQIRRESRFSLMLNQKLTGFQMYQGG